MKQSIIILTALFAGAANAQNMTGNELLSTCEQTESDAKFGYCLGYVSGVVEGMKWGLAVPLLMAGESTSEVEKTTGDLLGFCVPQEATLGQMRDVIVLYLRNNPAERHGSARIHAQLALAEAYPCLSE